MMNSFSVNNEDPYGVSSRNSKHCTNFNPTSKGLLETKKLKHEKKAMVQLQAIASDPINKNDISQPLLYSSSPNGNE